MKLRLSKKFHVCVFHSKPGASSTATTSEAKAKALRSAMSARDRRRIQFNLGSKDKGTTEDDEEEAEFLSEVRPVLCIN